MKILKNYKNNESKNFPHGIMFHHFHDKKIHMPGQGSISSETFNKIIQYLIINFNILSPDKFINKLKNKTLHDKDITLTFDDSLLSQYDIALPILEKFSLKAFFFVYNSAFSDNPVPLEFYRDFRINYFECIDSFYSKFFKLFEKNFPISFSKFKENYEKSYLSEFKFYTENDKKFRFIRDQILGIKRYYQLMEMMILDSNYSKESRREKLFMSTKELREIQKKGHNIGLHSSSHPTNIDTLNYDDQLKEYDMNYDFIKNKLGIIPNSMSHPCGKYNDSTLQILNKMKIKIGFRSSLGQNYSKSDLEIPREDHTNIYNLIKNN